MTRILSLAAALGLLALAGVAAAQEAASEFPDPLVRVAPTERPPLRELLTGDEFVARFDAARERLGDWSSWESSRAPVIGMRVAGVFVRSPLRDRVQTGDVFIRVNDQLLWGDSTPFSDEQRELQFYSSARNAIETTTVPAGKYGVQLVPDWRPELLYLRSEHRGPKWDELMLAAIHSRGFDPELAETALARAVAAGHPRDSLTAQIGAEIALMQNRPQVASDFAWFAEQAFEPDSDAVHPMLLLRVALANYHLSEALGLVQSAAGVLGDLHPAALQRLIDLHQSRPEAQRAVPPPSVLTEGRYRDPLLPRLIGSDRLSAVRYLPRFVNGEALQMVAETAHYLTWTFETVDSAPDFDVRLEFSATADGTQLNEYLRWFYLKANAVQHPLTAEIDPLYRQEAAMIAVSEMGDVRLLFGNTQAELHLIDPSVDGLTGRSYSTRILRAGGQMEIYLNGHRIYFGPATEDSPPVQFQFNVTGCTVIIKRFDADEMLSQ